MNTAEALRRGAERTLSDKGLVSLKEALAAAGVDFEQVKAVGAEYANQVCPAPELRPTIAAAWLTGFACCWGLAVEDITK